jgi:hypothetical protein
VAKTDEKVMALVQDEIRKTPDIQTSELYEKAKSAVSSVGRLSLRQFNARYPLQIKRRMAQGEQKATEPRPRARKPGAGRRSRRETQAMGSRDAVRQALLRFATELSGAEQRSDLVRVLAGVDGYVDEIVKAAAAR